MKLSLIVLFLFASYQNLWAVTVNPASQVTADSANTALTIPYRDASGNFAAGTITATLTGTATTVTALAIDSTKLNRAAVDSEKILERSITGAKLVNSTVDTTKLATRSVDTGKLNFNPVVGAADSGKAVCIIGGNLSALGRCTSATDDNGWCVCQ